MTLRRRNDVTHELRFYWHLHHDMLLEPTMNIQERNDIPGRNNMNPDEQGYNGWTNWETWHVALWADNDRALCNRACALGKRCADIRAGQVKNKVYDVNRAIAAFKRALAPAWKETRTFARDNGWPVGTVNWEEVAAHYIDRGMTRPNQPQPRTAVS